MIDVIVTGRSFPALQTALDLAEVGLKVMVLDGADQSLPCSWAEHDPEGVIAQFMQRIAEPIDGNASESAAAAEPQTLPATTPMLLSGIEWLPQPSPNVLGVPAVPFAGEATAILGSGGAFRAYLDRLTPLLTVGKTRMFGELVRKRMGSKVRDRLVDPQVFERYGVAASEVEVAIAAPGLNETLSRTGSLSTAVLAYADRNVARETRVTTSLGADAFRAELVQRLTAYGVELRSTSAVSVVPEADGWEVRTDDSERLWARALVADFGDSAVTADALVQIVRAVAPGDSRVYASMSMDRPDWLPEGSRAIARVNEWAITIDGVFTQATTAGSEPAASSAPAADSRSGAASERTDADRVTVELRYQAGLTESQAHELDELTRAEKAGSPSARAGNAGFADAQGRLLAGSTDGIRHVGTGVGISWLAGVDCDEIVLRAAPYRTVAAKHEASEKLAALETETPNLLVVGRAVHGDDQAAALSAAHSSAVHLRRRLLGLEE